MLFVFALVKFLFFTPFANMKSIWMKSIYNIFCDHHSSCEWLLACLRHRRSSCLTISWKAGEHDLNHILWCWFILVNTQLSTISIAVQLIVHHIIINWCWQSHIWRVHCLSYWLTPAVTFFLVLLMQRRGGQKKMVGRVRLAARCRVNGNRMPCVHHGLGLCHYGGAVFFRHGSEGSIISLLAQIHGSESISIDGSTNHAALILYAIVNTDLTPSKCAALARK